MTTAQHHKEEARDDVRSYVLDFEQIGLRDLGRVGSKNASLGELDPRSHQRREAPRKPIGICGQAPSDYPEFAEWLVGEGIDSISLNPDVAIATRLRIAAVESRLAGGRTEE
jgi:phosphoenolpyruvate synthase/pyruvate phosphate dikinase